MLTNLGVSLHETLQQSSVQSLFEVARSRHAVLVPFTSIVVVVDYLLSPLADDYARRDEIANALATEYQRDRNGVWSAALLGAFRPMLLRLVRGLHFKERERDDVEQLAIISFLETSATIALPCEGRLALTLRSRTTDAVRSKLRSERYRQRTASSFEEEEANTPALQGAFGGGIWRAADVETCVSYRRILERARRVLREDALEALLTTFGEGQTVIAYVDRAAEPNDARTRRATFERVRRQRSRSLATLRRLAGNEQEPAVTSSPRTGERPAVWQCA